MKQNNNLNNPMQLTETDCIAILQKAQAQLSTMGFDFTVEDIRCKNTKNKYSLNRQAVVMYLIAEEYSLKAIGTIINNKDHSTVIHLREGARDRIESDVRFETLFAYPFYKTIPDKIKYHQKQIELLNKQLTTKK